LGGEDRHANSILTAFYDLSVSPTGFDSAVFFALADLARARRGCIAFRIVFVPAGGSGFWGNETYDTGYKAWRLHHLLLPLATLFPTCRGVTLCATRDEAAALCRSAGTDIFPEGYTVAAPPAEAYQWAYFAAAMTNGEAWTGWSPPAAARVFVDQWLAPRARGRKVVTITLREARYHVEHNSNRQAWAAFARGLDQEKYFPVFLRDTEAVLDPTPEELRDFAVFAEPSFIVALRAALYLKAHLNLMTASGPMYLTWLHPHCAALIFRLFEPGDYRAAPTSLATLGLEPGGQLHFLGARQRIAWSGDDLDSIKAAFAEMEASPTPPGAIGAETRFAVARRLRLSARLGAARQIYAHLVQTAEDEVSAAGARVGLALIALNTGGRSGHLRRAFALLRLKNPDLRAAERAVAAGARRYDLAALLDLVDWCLRLDRLDRAQSICAATLSAWPESAEALGLSGEISLRLGQAREALSQLARAAELRPWSAAIRYRYGIALLLHGREEEAKAEFRATALNDPSHEAARLRLKALDPEHPLPEGFRYEDAIARRPAGAVGTNGEIADPISLPQPRHGRDVVWCHGRFHALPAPGLSVAWDGQGQRLVIVAPRLWLLSRPRQSATPSSIGGLVLARIADRLLYRHRGAEGFVSATLLSALDRKLTGVPETANDAPPVTAAP
jgi:tetratricopeptide (TPR) repeat protein